MCQSFTAGTFIKRLREKTLGLEHGHFHPPDAAGDGSIGFH
jgi:hypothetical protein